MKGDKELPMSQIIRAVYREGQFRLLDPVNLT
jgi:predicted DNA-binding antitoxin AbrB/MazE fold protein